VAWNVLYFCRWERCVSSKIRPDDWDRLFTPNAPRRGGPLRVLLNLFITLIVIALLAVGVLFARNLREQRIAQALATATSAAATAIPERTAAAQAQLDATATLVAARTATAVAQPAAPQLTASVFNGGNVREAPVSGRPVDQLQAGQIVQLLEKSDDGSWFKISYTRSGQTITGWVSKTLLTIDPAIEQQVP
jgi:hypothetical protein